MELVKRIVLMLGCAFVLLCQAVAFAHSMPREELYAGGVGIGCTLGYVKSIYGEPEDERLYEGDGIRSVTYIYSPAFSITGRTGIEDDRDDEELTVVGFTLTDRSMATPSGIRVGMPYSAVRERFGGVEKLKFYNGEEAYVYSIKAHEMCIYTDEKDIIIKISAATEV